MSNFIQSNFSITLPIDTTSSDKTLLNQIIFDLSGKEIIDVICNNFGISKFDVADSMTEDEIPDDVKTLLRQIVTMCS